MATMKKDIMQLIVSEEGQVRINNVCYLRRWTRNALNTPVDKLQLHFDNINRVCMKASDMVDIESRDYDGIINEIDIAISRFTSALYSELSRNLYAGYRNKD